MVNDFSRRLKYSTLDGWKAKCDDCGYSTGWCDTISDCNFRYEYHNCDKEFNKRSLSDR